MALLVQSFVPVGFMPKALADDGFAFLEFCPQGVSDEVMAIIHGDSRHAHNHIHDEPQGQIFDVDLIAEHPLICEVGIEPNLGDPHADHHHNTEVGAPQYHGSHAQTSEWTNVCPFALANLGEDLVLFPIELSSTDSFSGDQPDSTLAREIVAQLQRKNRSRAPPV